MSDVAKILVVADPTAEAQPAVARSLDLAARLGARLEVFACVYDQYLSGEHFFDSPGLAKSRKSFVRHHREWLERLLAGMDARNVELTTVVEWDNPLDEGIVREVLQKQPDLLVKDTHHHRRLRQALFSNTDWNLIRNCPCALWLVKPETPATIGRILAAVDPTHQHDKPASLDDRILEYAALVGKTYDASVQVLHSYAPVSTTAVSASAVPGAVIYPIDVTEEMVRTAHQQALDKLLRRQAEPPAAVHMIPGRTESVLDKLAEEENIELVVMGAVKRKPLKRIFIGSTAERVLEDLECDVLVVKPQQFVTPVEARAAVQD